MSAPSHATAADRIALTEAGLGRKVWAARELPDPLSRALWWKQRRWYFGTLRESLSSDDPAIFAADDEFYEARQMHELLIRELWMTRFCAREQSAWQRLAVRAELVMGN